MAELKPCPFCGCSMEVRSDFYPNGSKRIEPNGWHDPECPLDQVLWCFDVEDDGWTEDTVAESWNRRVGDYD